MSTVQAMKSHYWVAHTQNGEMWAFAHILMMFISHAMLVSYIRLCLPNFVKIKLLTKILIVFLSLSSTEHRQDQIK